MIRSPTEVLHDLLRRLANLHDLEDGKNNRSFSAYQFWQQSDQGLRLAIAQDLADLTRMVYVGGTPAIDKSGEDLGGCTFVMGRKSQEKI